MNQLVIDNPPAKLLMQIGDALLEEGAVPQAMELYRKAMNSNPGDFRLRLAVRMGSAEHGVFGASNMAIHRAIEGRYPEGQVFTGHGLAVWLKTNPFLDDSRFMELVEKHKQLLPLPNWHWNLNVALWAARQALKVPGDFVELGVFKGHTTLFLAEYLDFQRESRRWLLYDTFDGIPDDQLDAGWENINKITYKGTYSFEEVRDRFTHLPNVVVVQGRVPEILRAGCPDKIAFIHLDLNNASAEIAALDFIWDRLSPGGVLLLDDYCWLSAIEQHRAEKKWFEARELHVLELPTGQGVVIKPGI